MVTHELSAHGRTTYGIHGRHAGVEALRADSRPSGGLRALPRGARGAAENADAARRAPHAAPATRLLGQRLRRGASRNRPSGAGKALQGADALLSARPPCRGARAACGPVRDDRSRAPFARRADAAPELSAPLLSSARRPHTARADDDGRSDQRRLPDRAALAAWRRPAAGGRGADAKSE